jgi:diguanylate cyclase (GGDEF)-like protein
MSAAASPLIASLQESRARWRDLALMETALVFETDAAGRLAFLAPEVVLGGPAEAWLGQPAAALLGTPLRPVAQRGLRSWTQRVDATPCCLEITAHPLPDGGLRGLARDVTQAEHEAAVAARALRRATTLGHLLRLGTRQGGGTAGDGRAQGEAAGAAAALAALLGALPAALGAAGAALLGRRDSGWAVLAGAAAPPPAGTPCHSLAETSAGTALFAWREAGAPGFDAEETALVAALAMPAAALHAEALRQAALDAAAHRDALTGLLNRLGFEAGLASRIEAGGTLAFIDLDGLKPLNDGHGHEAGDAALVSMAARLRAVAGARDLAARLGGDEFCLWLAGCSEAEAARRVAAVGQPGPVPGLPQAGPAALRASLGLATRRASEDAAALIARADAAMYAVKRAKGAGRAA